MSLKLRRVNDPKARIAEINALDARLADQRLSKPKLESIAPKLKLESIAFKAQARVNSFKARIAGINAFDNRPADQCL
jgi:hypothetical protein